MSPLGFKARVGSLIRAWRRHTCYTFPLDLILVTNMKEAFHTMKHQLDELKEIIETLQPIREPLEKVIISY